MGWDKHLRLRLTENSTAKWAKYQTSMQILISAVLLRKLNQTFAVCFATYCREFHLSIKMRMMQLQNMPSMTLFFFPHSLLFGCSGQVGACRNEWAAGRSCFVYSRRSRSGYHDRKNPGYYSLLTSSYSLISILHWSEGHRWTELTQLIGNVSKTATLPLLCSLFSVTVWLFLHWWSSLSR